jgi:putative alpha-1,2-mannosidase
MLRLENGRTLKIEARNQSDQNVYVDHVTLNGRKLDRRYLTYAEIVNGGTLVFFMTARPPAGV